MQLSGGINPPTPWGVYLLYAAIVIDVAWFGWLIYQGESMKMYKTTSLMLLILLACAVMFGCATYQGVKTDTKAAVDSVSPPPDQSGLQAKLTSDLTAAIARAETAKDLMAPQRVICYKTILSLVPSLPSLPTLSSGGAAGVFDAFEVGAELAENTATVADSAIPAEVRVKLAVDCGPLEARANSLLARFGLKTALVAGKVGLIAK